MIIVGSLLFTIGASLLALVVRSEIRQNRRVSRQAESLRLAGKRASDARRRRTQRALK